MNKTSYICSQCKPTFIKGWVTIFSNDELHTFCCYRCYQSNPIIVPIKSSFKQTWKGSIIIPHNIPLINKDREDNIIVNDDDDDNDLDDYYDDNESISNESFDDY